MCEGKILATQEITVTEDKWLIYGDVDSIRMPRGSPWVLEEMCSDESDENVSSQKKRSLGMISAQDKNDTWMHLSEWENEYMVHKNMITTWKKFSTCSLGASSCMQG